MKRSVNDFHIRIFGDRVAVDILFQNSSEINIVEIFSEHGYIFFRIFKRNGFYIVENIDLSDRVGNDLRLFGRKLDPVRPISLIPVIFFRIVRSRYIDACGTAELSDRKRHFGRGTRSVEKECLYPVRGEDGADFFGKLPAHVTAVASDGYALFAGFRPLVFDEFRKPLRRISDGINIHPVQARAEDPAQSRGSETEHRTKSVLDLFFVGNGFQFFLCFFIDFFAVQPFFVILAVIHNNASV